MPAARDPWIRFNEKYFEVPCELAGLKGPCWQWTDAPNSNGYGSLSVKGIKVLAHRYSWETLRGPIPEGYWIDHLCRNHMCVNPDHLEPVPPWLNSRRGNGPIVAGSWQRAVTHCPKGHPYSGLNLCRDSNGGRRCVLCGREAVSCYRKAARSEEVEFRAEDIERFWSRVDKQSDFGCWNWRGALDRNGHGEFTCRGKKFPAHKLVYFSTYGSLSKGRQIRLTCDNNRCVNPAHFYVPSMKVEAKA